MGWLIFGLWGMLTFLGVSNGNHPIVSGFLAACITAVIVVVVGLVWLVWSIPV